MQLHTLKREHPNKKPQQVGRGGTRGKTSGRGGKGQTARAGNKRRPQMRDIIKKIPKLRGYRFASHDTKATPVNVGSLNIFAVGAIVSPKTLFENALIRRVGGKLPKVKILGTGDITVKVLIEGCIVSKTAKEKIEKAGGSIK
ncbi:MAG: 50S ribosomal protein L15 [Candidatus Nomurabacteria bacterium GW2011_GWF2_35_66]|uniref:Large ribosomal subunit protein uL15 n=1 Tax=Candidatus Nomurabacteria bacterium GW2011_GWE1_35_16 TaxID=1618761 RepID=A0A0G0BQJ3_9BACT|nr:MAG: 50S ribosomal protein L15 [Candidatus Nomurabacteria bacterium GW2011_GWF1_34_20]KKP61628.1 MAG: 50S ribosomal protein L15 [Candidatus Nomurabacteria bacterium GW2011_GWE2_34_25]KKP65921.1 MAG: 50S ribosomal protein L15 [Candidatus Nomurabacteria bacterium GW2011_GWE1_35_16]KKP82977.1 MAG: 50S ribosomal protein L15 [Candidatus Nomurabacteria bacterium GW2011_GWF2_35_66]HAE36291.1 50S ribosomal protein L15 [Candidatus Nomurabacteria bacterium]